MATLPGGKTGTAQKIDPVTHLYSKTMHIASFAGFAPVNNPVIAVAVVIDSPKGDLLRHRSFRAGFRRGSAAGARVPGRCRTISICDRRTPPKEAKVRSRFVKTTPSRSEDVNALFAAANDLPRDDPLRASQATASQPVQPVAVSSEPVADAGVPAKPAEAQQTIAASQSSAARSCAACAKNYITVSDGKKLSVPSLVGLPIRSVIEMAAAAGLEVEISGSGTAREQAPAPGTQVPTGTKIVVRCGR